MTNRVTAMERVKPAINICIYLTKAFQSYVTMINYDRYKSENYYDLINNHNNLWKIVIVLW